ncbi:MAG: hypothetical protein LIO74_07010 [Ruminococcus sp.]|nr:hypothetical protein [Ruminococcus sp.]
MCLGHIVNATFTSIDGVQVRLHMQAKTEEYSHARIYVFFPMERETQELLIGTESSGEYDNWRLDWREDDHIYRYLTTDERDFIENESTYTFGYYEN